MMYGLVLTGGQSVRMGTDKSSLLYHETPQRIFLYDLLKKFCEKVFISARESQTKNWEHNVDYLFDEVKSEGPLSGIISAIRKYPNVDWLIVACDMPYIQEEVIEYLIQYSDPSIPVNVFKNPERLHPEPLLSIWRTQIFADLLHYYDSGKRSPLKFLQSLSLTYLEVPKADWLLNINRAEDYAHFIKKQQD